MNRRLSLLILPILSLSILAGCATSNRLTTARDRLEQELVERNVDPDEVVVPYELSPEMKDWLGKRVPRIGSPQSRLATLLYYLLAEENLGLRYAKGYTGTAQEVFESKTANCLSFSHLFVGMARQLGVPVYYLGVKEVEGFEKEGDLVIVSNHVTVGHGPSRDQLILEFDLGPEVDYHNVEPLSDLTAMALYYSNRGAERMRAGELEAAVEALELATRLDPELASAWGNLGVGLRRLERWEDAEEAYRRALEIDPRFTTAYQNLASLLRRQGRDEEARELMVLVEEIGPRNPYAYLNLGDLSLARGRIDAARRLYRKAVHRYGDHADAHAALGLLELRLGNRDEAKRHLQRARKIDPDAERVRSLERRLDTRGEG